MRILLGPPGSGKTTLLLEQVRARVRAGAADFRYVAPTSTMREHISNQLAREGLLVRTPAIATLAGLLEELVPGAAVASAADLTLLTTQALDELNPRAFEPLRDCPGLAAALSAAAEELAGAGCGPAQWAALRSLRVWDGARLEALGQVYEAVENRLREHGLMRRAALLAEAARRVRAHGSPGVREFFFDGFFTFAPFELELLRELAAHARVTIALPEWAGAREAVERLRRVGAHVESLTTRRARPEIIHCPAADEQREAEEIALRILEARGEGYAWRDCGVIMRAPTPYAPLLETTFHRFGIPFRSYFARPLREFSAARCLMGLIGASLCGWEHAATVEALMEPACRAGGAKQFRRIVLEHLPGEGLAKLHDWADPAVQPVLDVLAAWPGAGGAHRSPVAWAAVLPGLLNALRPPEPGEAGELRGAAVRQFLSTAESAARLLPPDELTLESFWTQVRPALLEATVRSPGRRRDAVHLLDAYEARQWELPLVFVCGLKEGEFPRRAQPGPILSPELRLRLRQQGLPVALASERDAEERFLLEIAQTRATQRAYFSWPRFNDTGEPVLRSFALNLLPGREAPARRIRVEPRAAVPPLPRPSIDAHHLRGQLAARYSVHRATALESFLQCPFQFFLRYTMELEGQPEPPADRLNALLTGIVVHDVLKEWRQRGGDIGAIFESVWRRALARHRVPAGYDAEFQRSLLRRSLIRYAAQEDIEPGWRIFSEQEVELDLDACRVKGRIDRFDVNGDNEVRVYDYKFTTRAGLKRRQERLEAGLSLQGGLYLLALQRQGYTPLSFSYVSLKNGVAFHTIDEPDAVAALMQQARENASRAALEILNGRIDVDPQDPDACAYCEFRNACRAGSLAAREETAAAAG